MWFKTTAERAGDSSDVRWKTVTQTSGYDIKLCHRQWTDEYVERPETLMRQNVVVVWLECLLVDVVRRIGRYFGARPCWLLYAKTKTNIYFCEPEIRLHSADCLCDASLGVLWAWKPALQELSIEDCRENPNGPAYTLMTIIRCSDPKLGVTRCLSRHRKCTVYDTCAF